jgi:hypothetical protein
MLLFYKGGIPIMDKRLFPYFLTVLLAVAAQPSLFAQEEGGQGGGRWQARSMVETKVGIVATSQTLASGCGSAYSRNRG